MTVGIAMLRGINVGGKHVLPMAELRTMCEGVGLRDVRTYIQSGNVVFRAGARELAGAARKLEVAIEEEKGFRPRVVMRGLEEMRAAADAGVFAGADAARLLVMFLDAPPGDDAERRVAAVIKGPEEAVVRGREVYLHFPDGVGKSKLSMAAVEKAVGAAGTCRNMNTIRKLVEMGEGMGSG